MKSGISRYTLGGFNQSALDDVYNKAKEIYQDEVQPPSGGITQVTLSQLWEDTHLAHDLRPILSPYSHGQQKGPVVSILHGSEYQITPWIEIEEGSNYGLTDANVGCTQGNSISQSTNTVVEKGHSYLYAKINGTWSLVKKTDKTWIGQYNPINDNVRSGCGVPWRAPLGGGCFFGASAGGWDTFMPGWLLNTDGSISRNEGAYQHPYDSPTGRWTKTEGTTEVCHISYVRLVLKDPNGVDDRHLSNFITHQSVDAYNADGAYAGDRGIGRYKRVTNEWVANTLTTQVAGLTEQEFLAEYAGLEALLPTTP